MMDAPAPPPPPPSSSSSSFSAAHYFPARRRVWQACTNCRVRKTRCDAAKPKCSLCMAQDLECIYRDSNQPRIEQNTRILLERIQMLEDRLFSSPLFTAQQTQQPASTPPPPQAARHPTTPGSASASASASRTQTGATHDALHDAHDERGRPGQEDAGGNAIQSDGSSQIPIPLSHTANANHVFEWPIVKQLLSETEFSSSTPPPPLPPLLSAIPGGMRFTEATDVFFHGGSHGEQFRFPPESWRLFQDRSLPVSIDAADRYREAIHEYFAEVNIFFPLLALEDVVATFDEVVASEQTAGTHVSPLVAPSRYCLLLLVLCLGSFVCTDANRISLDETAGRSGGQHHRPSSSSIFADFPGLDELLWRKSRLLLGFVSSEITLEAAQCTMLARLFWVSLIYEGDFVSEISITLPSGIARYEDVVPYPAPETPKHHRDYYYHHHHHHQHAATTTVPTPDADADAASPASTSFYRTEELVAFQISTNAAIRRFLNRVNSVVYDSRDQFRMTRASYADWLLRTTADLWSYHGALYRNLPDFLLTSQPRRRPPGPPDHEGVSSSSPAAAATTPGIIRVEELGNNPWNVLRLKGRYYAGQYIIHRPFIEYVMLNVAHFETHPCKGAVLERCRMCLEGCKGFINVFDIDPANSMTGLFATGMVTFTMVVILRVATMCAVFREILPPDIEQAMFVGTRNLRRFSISVREFEWHLGVLDRLEAACKNRMAA